MWEQLKRVVKPRGAVVLFAAQPFLSILVSSNLEQFKYEWIWDKRAAANPQLAKITPLKCHESIAVFGDGSVTYNPQGLEPIVGKPPPQGPRSTLGHIKRRVDYQQENANYPKSIQYFKLERGFHPTQKPVELLRYLVRTYTNPGETVLDFTMGSGTCGVACAMEGRHFIGVELDAGYFDIARKRIESVQPALMEAAD